MNARRILGVICGLVLIVGSASPTWAQSNTGLRTKSSEAGKVRTWIDSTGQHKVAASFLEFKDGVVHLKKEDGTVLKIGIDRLSESGQAYVREMGYGRNTAMPGGVPSDKTNRDPQASFEPVKLTAEQSRKYRVDENLANLVRSGNLFDPGARTLRMTNAEIERLRTVLERLNIAKPGDRTSVVTGFVRIVGEKRAREIGLVFYDSHGRAEYSWPADIGP